METKDGFGHFETHNCAGAGCKPAAALNRLPLENKKTPAQRIGEEVIKRAPKGATGVYIVKHGVIYGFPYEQGQVSRQLHSV